MLICGCVWQQVMSQSDTAAVFPHMHFTQLDAVSQSVYNLHESA